MSLMITCPICGRRNGYEFRYGGEDKGARPDQESLSPEAWCDYVHMTDSKPGIQREWWVHRNGCGSWFTIYRDVMTNLQVYPGEEEAAPCQD